MPLGGTPLRADQIATLKRWIDGGAVWPATAEDRTAGGIQKHWSYIKPVRPPVPSVNGAVRNPIDNFILARLQKENLTFSPEASKETLIRRVSLDLIGLPPTLEEIDTFLADDRPDAYERLVERLLASPHYGERWARPWLDLARYADTNGYEADRRRTMWKYRDWVIDALNRDMPFDRFTIEQIAGDMLPGATREQKVATGFHRNTMFNEEGGVDKEEAHFEVLVDRVNTTATVWLGSTIGCAQCHNHKYDPFSQKEYYQLMAFFANSARDTATSDASNKGKEPVLDLATAGAGAGKKEIEGRDRCARSQAEDADAGTCKGPVRVGAQTARSRIGLEADPDVQHEFGFRHDVDRDAGMERFWQAARIRSGRHSSLRARFRWRS